MMFSFFLAAQLSVPFGEFLAENWTQLPHRVRVMIGFLVLFVAAVVALFLVVQGTYQKTQLFASHPVIDEVLGGVLGSSRACSCCCSSRSSWTSTSCTRRRPPRRPSCRSCGPSGTALNASGIGAALPRDGDPGLRGPGRRSSSRTTSRPRTAC